VVEYHHRGFFFSKISKFIDFSYHSRRRAKHKKEQWRGEARLPNFTPPPNFGVGVHLLRFLFFDL